MTDGKLTPSQQRREKLRRRAIRLRAKGLSYLQIGERLLIGDRTAWRYVNEEVGDG